MLLPIEFWDFTDGLDGPCGNIYVYNFFEYKLTSIACSYHHSAPRKILLKSLEKEYETKYNSQIPGPVIIYIMKEIMSDSGMRLELINSYKEFIDENNITKHITLLNIFNQIKFLK